MTVKVFGLNAEEKQQLIEADQQRQQSIIDAAQVNTVSLDNQLVFFAAFDGTSNDERNEGNETKTNVLELFRQVSAANHANVLPRYFPGPGTKGTLTASSWLPPQVTEQVLSQADAAYQRFAIEAKSWLETHDGGSVTAVLTAFSRGSASAAIFSQMLYQKGLVDGDKVLIAPGQIAISAGVLFDPVMTGVGANLAFAPNVKNVVRILAENEYRYAFKAADYEGHPGITTIRMLGNHSDIGGSYDHGIAALSLEAANAFFKKAGLPIAPVAAVTVDGSYVFNPNDVAMHDEGVGDGGRELWSEYGSYAQNTQRQVDHVATFSLPVTADGVTTQSLLLYNGNRLTIVTPSATTPTSARSEKVQEDHTASFLEELRGGVKIRDVSNYYSPESSYPPSKKTDETVTKLGTLGVKETVEAQIFVPNDSLALEIVRAAQTIMVSVKGSDEASLDTLTQAGVSFRETESSGLVALTGSAVNNGGNRNWIDGNNTSYEFRPNGRGSRTGTLTITGGILGDTDKIIFNDFDVAKAQTAAGFLGIRLGTPEIATVVGASSNPFDDTNFDPNAASVASSTIKEGGLARYSLFLPYGTDKDGQKVKVQLAGANAGRFSVVLGDDVVDLASTGGEFEVAVAPGAREVSFALQESSDVDTNSTLTLSATLVDADGNPAHQTHLEANITLNAVVEADTPATQTVMGTAAPEFLTPYGVNNSRQASRGFDGQARTDFQGGGGNDLVIGSSEHADVVDGGEGNDWLVSRGSPSGERAETLSGGAGNDVVEMDGAGKANGGEGNDIVAGAYQFDLLFSQTAFTDVVWEAVGSTFRPSIQPGFGIDTGGNMAVGVGFELADTSGVAIIDPNYTSYRYDNTTRVLTFTRADGGTDNITLTPVANLRPLEDALDLHGDAGDDVLVASNGDDLLYGDEGDDRIVGGGGADAIFGGIGDDAIGGGAGDDFIDAGDGDDTLFGERGDDALFGGAGNDLLQGDLPNTDADVAGNDYLDGEAGNDTLLGEGGADTLFGGEGDDLLIGDSNDTPLALQGNDELNGGEGSDQLYGRGGDDVLVGAEGDDQLFGDVGNDSLEGDAGNDLLQGGAGNDVLEGGDGTDILAGGDGDDRLWGDEGSDTLSGGSGDDVLDGGTGGDAYFYGLGDGDDEIIDRASEGNSLHLTGVGIDDVSLGLGSLKIELPDGGEIHIDGFDPENAEANPVIDTFFFSESGFYSYAQLLSRKGISIRGTPNEDTLLGTSAADNLFGLESDDVIYGLAGDDKIDGGAGIDQLIGGLGDDTYIIGSSEDAEQDQIVENPFYDGIDTVLSSVTFDLARAPNVEILRLSGDASTDGSGSGLSDQIYGNAGNNVLTGREGDDLIDGGDGSDTLDGDAGDDVLLGGKGDDVLRGGAGIDALTGGQGNDTLDGGAGNEVLDGNGGDDAYVLAYGGGQDIVAEDRYDPLEPVGGTDAVLFGTGIVAADVSIRRDLTNLYVALPTGDTLTVQDNYARHPSSGFNGAVETARFADGTFWDATTLQTHVKAAPATNEADVLYAGGGGDVLNGLAGDDRLYGFGGDDVLDGGAGDDLLSGGDGNDLYLFGRDSGHDTLDDSDISFRFTPTEGDVNAWYGYDYGFSHSDGEIDTVRLSAGIGVSDVEITQPNGALTLNIKDTGDSLTLVGWSLDPFTSNGRTQLVEFADGTVWDRRVVALMAEAPQGTEGNDFLVGTFCGNTIDAREGSDSIHGLYGNDMLLGGEGDDSLFGDQGDDILDGGTGDDALSGGEGNDTYRFGFGSGQDYLWSPSLETGQDTIALGEAVTPEHLKVANIRDALDFAPLYELRLDSGDSLRLGSLSDLATIARVELADGRSWDAATLVQAALTGGPGDDQIGGGDSDDLILGNAGDDTLNGGAGSDILDGGLGDDVLVGGAGDDTYHFGRGSGHDVVSFDGFNMGYDRIVLSADVRPDDVSVAEGFLHIRGTADSIEFFTISEVDFADGSAWFGGPLSLQGDVRPWMSNELYGATEGSAGDDALTGSSENDAIWAFEGNDVLGGGAGDDILHGGPGNDTYVYSRGDGKDRIDQDYSGLSFTDVDRIHFAGGIGPQDIRVVLRQNDLYFLDGDSADALIVSNWALGSGNQVDQAVFDDGSVWDTAAITARIVTEGTEGNDTLNGTSGSDVLSGFGGNDTINGLGGDDVLDGGTGNDSLTGGAGSDTYRFGHGFGVDTVFETDNTADFNQLVFNADVLPSEISVNTVPFPFLSVRLSIAGTTDMVVLQPQGGPLGQGQAVDQVVFLSDGTTWTWQQLLQRNGTIGTPSGSPGGSANHAPMLVTALADASVLQGQLLRYRITSGAFSDPDGNTLSYSAGATGDAPVSMYFDPTTRSIIFTPGYADVGEHQITVTAVDPGGLQASDTFTLAVHNVNDAPFLAMPLMDVTVAPHATLVYQIPANAFSDVDGGDSLAYSATLADGSVLPVWLSFDSTSGVFAGLPDDQDVGRLDVRVTASDNAGLEARDTFAIVVAEPSGEASTAPYVQHALADQSATEDLPFAFQVGADTFGDADDVFSTSEGVHSCLIWSASRADGSALPQWLRFYAGTRTFGGTPDNDAVGTVDLRLTATDEAGDSASVTFALTVANVNDAPRLVSPISDQTATAGVELRLILPDSFIDLDAGDVLSLSARLASGDPLPTWLQFDAATRTFSGTPALGDAGSLDIAVTATDIAGESAADVFLLQVAGGNRIPSAVDDVAVVQEDAILQATGNVLVNDNDPDAGTILAIAGPGTYTGSYGELTLEADGSYAYVLANDSGAVQALAAGTEATDAFDYAATDGAETADAQLRVSVLGTNDAPYLRHPLGHVTVTEGESFQLSLATDTFTDVDTGDRLHYSAALSGGSPLPDWLAFDPAARVFSGVPSATDIGTLALEVTATDLVGATAGTSFALTVMSQHQAGDTIVGTEKSDHLGGTSSDDTIDGRGGNDTVHAGDGWDIVYGGAGNDKLYGEGGNDILQGGSGNDALVDSSGNGVLDGGSGNDVLTGGSGGELLVGGTGNDTLHLGNGPSVIAFNNGDGHDTVYADGGGSATLSLGGGGFDYASLRFEKSGDDLVLHTNRDDQLTFKDWYTGKNAVDKLQIILDATDVYDPDSSDPLYNCRVETFDFRGLVQRFDEARAESPYLTSWEIANALLELHLSGADDAALGGDLAYWYGRNGSLSGISVQAAQQVIGAPLFGAEAQQLHAFSGLQDGFVKLT
jgi:VCBS repeat-containing protein